MGHLSQATNREGLKLYLARPCLPEQDLVFPTASPFHQEAYTNLLASSIREQAEETKRSIIPQVEQRTHYRKLNSLKKQKVIAQLMGQDKTLEKKKQTAK